MVSPCQLSGNCASSFGGDDDQPHTVTSDDVNDYLREITGEEITAKDFRTRAGTNLAALAPLGLEVFDSQAKAKKYVVQAVEAIAKMLGNTPAIFRKCYIHPRFSTATSMGTCSGR
jgi:DNA topoisomerase I